MNTYGSTVRTMRLVILVWQLGLILRTEAQIPAACVVSSTNRPPENSDITVVCGTKHMDLSIYLCPIYQALYNETLMVLNDQSDRSDCYGTADWNVDPPVLKFKLPMNESSISFCNNNFKIINQVGTGEFSQFSNVQYVNISGSVTSVDLSQGTITYRQQILYKFSCYYPMHYIVNNTQLAVGGVSLAITDNNGSFVSTLSMHLYRDENHFQALNIPQSGLNLKTKIYVVVMATNLTERFNVLLDRCYASTSPYPESSTFYDLFVGCQRDAQTKVEHNGDSQKAYFSFEVFRFVEHKNQTVSTFYLHCLTRLCEVSECNSLKPQNCSVTNRRRKREALNTLNATITSTAIVVGEKTAGDAQNFLASSGMLHESNYSSPVVAVIVCIIILTLLLIAMAGYFAWYIRRRKPIMS